MTRPTAPGSAFRHDPVKLLLRQDKDPAPDYRKEPAVCGYRRLTYRNETRNETLAVPISASPAIVRGVGAVFASDDGFVRLFDTDLGKAYWERRLDSSIYSSVITDADHDRVIVAATSGLVSSFDLTGRLAWSTRLPVPVFATGTILPRAGVLVLAAFRSRCIGLSLATGEVVFDCELPRPWSAEFGGSAAHRDPYASPVTTRDDTALVCCAEHVLCLAADGSELWRHELGRTVKASPVAVHATGQAVVLAVDGTCRFLDDRTGAPVAELSIGCKLISSPAVSAGVLALGTADGAAVGINTSTHRIMWTAAGAGPRSYTSFSVTPEGDFVAVNAAGNVRAVGRTDGRFLWETSQVLGLPDHEPSLDTTPVCGGGAMYCGSYSGVAYYFRFPQRPSKERL